MIDFWRGQMALQTCLHPESHSRAPFLASLRWKKLW